MKSLLIKYLAVASLRKYVLVFALLLLTFFGIFTIYNKFIYTFGFTDEGDNISIGKFLLDGKTLYRDVFSQH